MFKILSLFIVVTALNACALFTPETVVPLKTMEEKLGSEQSDTLIIFLPGIRDSDKSFFKHGFVDALRHHDKAVDVVAANTHFGYYKERSFIERLRVDVIEPAKNKGYQNIWLVGVSLGGFGSLVYSVAHPDDITGVIMLAPYLGDKELIKSIDGYPNLEQWAQAHRDSVDEIAQVLWLPLVDSNCLSGTPLYLAVGVDDKFIRANQLLASRCANIQLLQAEGGHDWQTWQGLWHELLKETGAF